MCLVLAESAKSNHVISSFHMELDGHSKENTIYARKNSFFQQNHMFTIANQVGEIGTTKDTKVSGIFDLDV